MSVDARDSSGRTALFWVCVDGSASIARFLLRAGANPNARNREATPLSNAVNARNIEAVKLLLDAGADRKAANWEGQTQLDLARQFARYDLIQLLEKQ